MSVFGGSIVVLVVVLVVVVGVVAVIDGGDWPFRSFFFDPQFRVHISQDR